MPQSIGADSNPACGIIYIIRTARPQPCEEESAYDRSLALRGLMAPLDHLVDPRVLAGTVDIVGSVDRASFQHRSSVFDEWADSRDEETGTRRKTLDREFAQVGNVDFYHMFS